MSDHPLKNDLKGVLLQDYGQTVWSYNYDEESTLLTMVKKDRCTLLSRQVFRLWPDAAQQGLSARKGLSRCLRSLVCIRCPDTGNLQQEKTFAVYNNHTISGSDRYKINGDSVKFCDETLEAILDDGRYGRQAVVIAGGLEQRGRRDEVGWRRGSGRSFQDNIGSLVEKVQRSHSRRLFLWPSQGLHCDY